VKKVCAICICVLFTLALSADISAAVSEEMPQANSENKNDRSLPPQEEIKTSDELLQMLKDSINDRDGFVALFLQHGSRLKDSSLYAEFNILQGNFLEHEYKEVCGNFKEALDLHKKWVEALILVYGEKEKTMLSRVGTSAGSLLRNRKKGDVRAAVTFSQQITKDYRDLLKQYTGHSSREGDYIQQMTVVVWSLESMVPDLPHISVEDAKTSYPEILSVFDEFWNDPVIPAPVKQSELGRMANYIRQFGYPDMAKTFLDKYLSNTPVSDYRPAVLEVLFYMHLNQYADRVKAKYYLDLYSDYDYEAKGEVRNPKQIEWASNCYYTRFGLSDDQLKRFAAGHNHEMKEKTRNIGEKLL